jgi:hypothetical protein
VLCDEGEIRHNLDLPDELAAVIFMILKVLDILDGHCLSCSATGALDHCAEAANSEYIMDLVKL